jgi:glycosyltransferase involved in cell wall biosynthesis
MRIAIDASSLLTRHPRGEGKTLLRLYQEIARIRPGWRFVFLGMQETDSAAEIRRRIPGSVIRSFDLPGYRWNLWENIGLPFAAWSSGADLLHCSSSSTPSWSLVPMVMTVHDVIPLLMDDGASTAGAARFRRGLSAGVRKAKKIITVSENSHRDLIRLMHPAADKVTVVHWGIDLPPSPPIPAEHNDRHLVLGFGGGGSRRKNTPTLIRMFAKVAAAHPTASLCVLGVSDARQRAELQTLVEQCSLQARVNLEGYVSDAELESYYARAACLVYISLYEGFGLPPLEAMAHGVPVVASNRSSVPEVVGSAGTLVDPEHIEDIAAATLGILEDRNLRSRLAELAWQQAHHFTWRETAEKTVAVFEDALLR